MIKIAISSLLVLTLGTAGSMVIPATSVLADSQQDSAAGKQIMKDASVEDIINELSRSNSRRKTRGIKIFGSAPPDATSTAATSPTVEAAPAPVASGGCYSSDVRAGTRGLKIAKNQAAMVPPARKCHPGFISQIRFSRNSAEIAHESAMELDKIAMALSSPKLASNRFVIAGHTDVTGSEAYNLALSERRAAAVVEYLQRKGVSPQRMAPQGRGEHELLDRNDPMGAVNRRVEIINLSR